MEYQKIINLLNEANDFKFATRQWTIANDNSKANIYNTELLKSNLCDYNHTYI